jgi:molybdopterin molybdotransferase
MTSSPPAPVVVDAPWLHARALARGLGSRLPAESIGIRGADRRILAAPVHALTDLPRFDASAMDGWAVSGAAPWTVTGTVHAGDSAPGPLRPGTAMRIATGAPTPAGADAVLRSERGILDGDRLSGPATPDDIRHAGEECRAGELLAEEGTELSPALLGLLAAAGHDTVSVTRRPRVALLLLGDELLESGVARGGLIRDALGPQVPAWLARAGADCSSGVAVPDSFDALCAALADADGDLVVTTGSTAAGPRDHLRAAIVAVGGSLVVDQVAVRPGHPMLLARIGNRPLVALPGNPQAAVVALLTLGFPLVDALLGRPERPLLQVPLAVDVTGRTGQQRLVAGTLGADGFRLAPLSGSAMLRGLAASTGYALIPAEGARTGERVDWLALP